MLQGAGKARVDAEVILEGMGAENIGMKRTFSRNAVYDYFRNLLGIARAYRNLSKGDILFVQYPLKKYYRLVCALAHARGASVVTLVHDLGCFRRRRLTVEEEIAKLSRGDVVIVANDPCAEWLDKRGFKMPVTCQIAWDYLSDAPTAPIEAERTSCLFVGNVDPARNGFLYKLPKNIHLHLYGSGAPDQVDSNITVHGVTDPDRIISEGKGRFGIIWYDSELAHTDSGYIGEWIKYCNPHKLGLYMRAGKPVIVWKGAAAARFVAEEGIGLCLDTLSDLDKTLSNVSDEDYDKMRRNVMRVSALMADGHFLKKCVLSATQTPQKR